MLTVLVEVEALDHKQTDKGDQEVRKEVAKWLV